MIRSSNKNGYWSLKESDTASFDALRVIMFYAFHHQKHFVLVKVMAVRHLHEQFFDTPCDITINDRIYTVQRKLDNGSFGQVFVANEAFDKKELVAIKIV